MKFHKEQSGHDMTLSYSPQLKVKQMYSKTKELSKLIKCLELKSNLYFLEEWKKVVSVKNKKVKLASCHTEKVSYPNHVKFSSSLTVFF